jgi:hypothetical protein
MIEAKILRYRSCRLDGLLLVAQRYPALSTLLGSWPVASHGRIIRRHLYRYLFSPR